MNTSNFLDANVWLALLWTAHIHHEKAFRWWQGVPNEPLYYSRVVQLTVLRLLTTAGVMGADVRTMAAAWKAWDVTSGDARIVHLAEPEGLEIEFRSLSRLGTASPKVWADAYLLAFARTSGSRLVTFDRALQSHGVEVLVLE